MKTIVFDGNEISLEEAADLFAEFQEEKQEAEKDMRRLKDLIVGSVDFPDGVNTAHIMGSGVRLTVQKKREKPRWDQDKLQKAAVVIGEDKFGKMFDWEYGPKKQPRGNDSDPNWVDVNSFINLDANGRLVADAMITQPETFALSVKRLEAV